MVHLHHLLQKRPGPVWAGQLLLICFWLVPGFSRGQAPFEGMWLPEDLPHIALNMRKAGNKLPLQAIFSDEAPSLGKAAVRMNRGECTGTLVSPEGLLLTNHHCLLDELQHLPEAGWRGGLWAANTEEEVPLPGVRMAVLLRMENVTEEIIGPGFEDHAGIASRQNAMTEAIMREEDVWAEVKAFDHGNAYRLYVYREYRDVRLVGLPRQGLVRWAYDDRNEGWPRYAADFAYLRLYMAPDSSTAEYAADNIPAYTPDYVSPSLKERSAGEFSLVVGYPGATHRKGSSLALKQLMEEGNLDQAEMLEFKARQLETQAPAAIATEGPGLDLYLDMRRTARYLRGQVDMLRRFEVLPQREKQERDFVAWALKEPDRKARYAGLLRELEQLRNDHQGVQAFIQALYGGVLAAEAPAWSLSLLQEVKPLMKSTRDARAMGRALQGLRGEIQPYVDRLFPRMDRQVLLKGLMAMKQEVPQELQPPILEEVLTHRKARRGDSMEEKFQRWIAYAYDESILTDRARLMAFFQEPELDVLEDDPLIHLVDKLITYYRQEVALVDLNYENKSQDLMRRYAAGLQEMMGEPYYPEANSTLRISYGQLAGYQPADAVVYEPFSSFEGMARQQNGLFQVPDELERAHALLKDPAYLQEGKLPVCFMTSNDISAGNSGSPVLDAQGHLMGLVYDANPEAMASDYQYIAGYQRALCVDIRYILWVTQEAGAGHLVNEMNPVKLGLPRGKR